jgi:hypothetical protein
MRQAKIRTVRQRIGRLPEELPTADELAAIEQASREFSEGKFITLKQLRHELGDRRQQSRAKKSQARSRR